MMELIWDAYSSHLQFLANMDTEKEYPVCEKEGSEAPTQKNLRGSYLPSVNN